MANIERRPLADHRPDARAAWDGGFHQYGLKWAEDRVTFFVDGVATRDSLGDLLVEW